MSHSIENMPRPVCRRLKKIVQMTTDKDYARRAQAPLHLAAGYTLVLTAELACAARPNVGRWRSFYEEFGEAGQAPVPRGRTAWTVTNGLAECLTQVLEETPQNYGCVRVGVLNCWPGYLSGSTPSLSMPRPCDEHCHVWAMSGGAPGPR